MWCLILQGLSLKDLKDPSWVRDIAKADKIAAAVAAWALDRGATSWCHWFQPMAAAYRHGQSAQVQMSFMTFDSDGKPKFNFSVRGTVLSIRTGFGQMLSHMRPRGLVAGGRSMIEFPPM